MTAIPIPPLREARTWPRRRFLLGLVTLCLAACSRNDLRGHRTAREPSMPPKNGTVKITFLHHSTGGIVWKGGLPRFIRSWNAAHGTDYEISEMNYPSATGGHHRLSRILPGRILGKLISHPYPWDNYPYDYWNLWVAHTGEQRDRGELNLEDLTRSYDVIVFKHCFPVSRIKADEGPPDVSSPKQTLANYKQQYEALKVRLHQFPNTRFILWTGAALTQASTHPEEAERARQFSTWVKEAWDEQGDNLFIWDFRELETKGGLYLKPEYAHGPNNSHPAEAFATMAAPLLGQRIVDVIEGRGDRGSLTGQ